MFFGFQSEKAMANAERLVQQGKFAGAIEIYEKLLAQQPDTLSLKNNLGDLYVQVGRTQKALELFSQVADYLEKEGLHSRAIAVMKKMLKLDSAQAVLQRRLARALTDQGMIGESRSLWLSILDRAERDSDWSTVDECITQLLNAEPESLSLLARSAELQQKRGNSSTAADEWHKLGRKAIERGAFDRADDALRHLQRLDPDSPGYALLRVRKELMLGHLDAALALIPRDEVLFRDQAAASEAWQLALDADDLPRARHLALLANECGDSFSPVQYALALQQRGLTTDVVEWITGDSEWLHRPELQSSWLDLLNEVLSVEPGNVPALHAWLALAVRPEAGIRADTLAERRLRMAEAALEQGDPLTALEQFRHMVRQEPSRQEWRARVRELEQRLGLSLGISMEPPSPPERTRLEADQPAGGISASSSSHPVPPPADSPSLAIDAALKEFDLTTPSSFAVTPSEDDAGFLDLEDDWAEVADGDLDDRIAQIQFFTENGMLEEARQALDEELAHQPGEPRLAALDQILRARAGESGGFPAEGALHPGAPADDFASSPAPDVFSLTPLEPAAFAGAPNHPPSPRETSHGAFPPSQAPGSSLDWLETTPPQATPESAPGDDGLLSDALSEPATENTPAGDSAWADWLQTEKAAEPGRQNPSAPPPAAGPNAAANQGQTARLLDDLFLNFRETVEGKTPAAASDPEHQYNMGVAYFEMGLFEEAVAELQKAFLGWEESAEPPRDRLLSCGSTIALSFQQMKRPEVALTWYRRTIDAARLPVAESIGLLYEEGRLLEQLGRREEARNCYRQVYATDIDYQDVAECLKRTEAPI